VQKKMYGLTPSQYVGGVESPYAAKLDQDRINDLETRRDELRFLGKDLDKEDLDELNRLKSRRQGAPSSGSGQAATPSSSSSSYCPGQPSEGAMTEPLSPRQFVRGL